MAKDLNKVMVIGRLGQEPVSRFTPNGKAVTTFSVASSRNVKEGDSWQEQTEWFRVVAWERLAETARDYLKKGNRVYVEGRLQTRKYMDKDNVEKSITEVIANDLILLEGKRDQAAALEDDWSNNTPAPAKSNGNSRNSKPTVADFDDIEPEDIPF